MDEHQLRHLPFKPSKNSLNYFEEHPNLISEKPVPFEETQKMITLPRNIEKDIYWNPNSKV